MLSRLHYLLEASTVQIQQCSGEQPSPPSGGIRCTYVPRRNGLHVDTTKTHSDSESLDEDGNDAFSLNV